MCQYDLLQQCYVVIFSEVFQNIIVIQASGHYEISYTIDEYERGGDVGLYI